MNVFVALKGTHFLFYCPVEEKKNQPVRICLRTVILKRVGSGTPVTSSLTQVPILFNSD